MNLLTIISTLLLTLLATSSLACKCINKDGGKPQNEATRRACRYARGIIVEGAITDCDADSMSQKLSDFHFRCGTYNSRSDCRCPHGC
jgi:hypothetical protein